MRNLRLEICYDGTRYRGWQRLGNTDQTVQGKLEEALSRILGEPIEISGSGRTDAGVHAMRQVANFHCQSSMPCDTLLANLRMYLPEDIGIYSCKEAGARFHARLNCTGKTYRYRIWNSGEPCVFQRRFLWVYPEALDLEQMQNAARSLTGTHDFSAFCGNSRFKKSTVRTVTALSVERHGKELWITASGDGFLQGMVRILVGTLVEVGSGTRRADSVTALFGAKREEAGFLAPAKGLCLMEVTY